MTELVVRLRIASGDGMCPYRIVDDSEAKRVRTHQQSGAQRIFCRGGCNVSRGSNTRIDAPVAKANILVERNGTKIDGSGAQWPFPVTVSACTAVRVTSAGAGRGVVFCGNNDIPTRRTTPPVRQVFRIYFVQGWRVE